MKPDCLDCTRISVMAVAVALAAALAWTTPAQAGFPFVVSLDATRAFPGASVQIGGFGFGADQGLSAITINGLPYLENATYWSDTLVNFTLPYLPAQKSVEVRVFRDQLISSNPATLDLDYPGTVYFTSPPPGAVLTGLPITVRVAPEYDHGQVSSVFFDYRMLPNPNWVSFGVDADGSSPHYGTTVWVGNGDGWSALLADPPILEGPIEFRATAIDSFGQTMTGTALYVYDPTPLAPRLLDNQVLAVSAFDGDLLEVELEFTDAQIESLLLAIYPVRWHHKRTLAHGDQDEMDIKDKKGNDVSNQACGPVAAAACLKWFGDRFPVLDQDLEALAKKLAKEAGTGPKGTVDADLVAAIKAILKAAGLDPNLWQVTLQSNPKWIWRSMIEGFNRDSCDKILTLQQHSTVDVTGDGLVDSTDVVGHFVTVSSRGSRNRDYTVTEPPPGSHVMGYEEYVDFMNPATGQTEEYLVDALKRPPVIVGMKLNDSTEGEVKIVSVVGVQPPAPPPPPPIQTSVVNKAQTTIVAAFPVPGAGTYTFAIPGASLPAGPALMSFIGKAVGGSQSADFSSLVVVSAITDAGFIASITSGNAPFAVTFTNTSAPIDSVLGWEWDFDTNGTVDSTDPSPTWVYTAPGDYTVTMRSLNAHGEVGVISPNLVHVGGTASAGNAAAAVSMIRACQPNPFHSSTVVSFALARGGPTQLDVISVDGRRVRTLVRGNLQAGEHTVQWNGSDDRGQVLPTGLYFVRLASSDGARPWRRLMLVR